MRFDKSKINKILVISLSNIGDVILTLPVMDILIRDFPRASFSVVVGPKAQTLFKDNPSIHKVHIFDKKQAFWKTIQWVVSLCGERFDLVVDLRNTAIPFLIFPRYRTSWLAGKNAGGHMKYKHLQRLRGVYPYDSESQKRYALSVPPADEAHVRGLLRAAWGSVSPYVVVAPGAANEAKRWTSHGFIEICCHLMLRDQVKIVFVGDEHDRRGAERIAEVLGGEALNLCGRTTLVQSAAVVQNAVMVLASDSAPMHLASYMDVPVLALFGPSDARKYGPWGLDGHYLQKNQDCPGCQSPNVSAPHTCMAAITGRDVLDAFQIVHGRAVFTPPQWRFCKKFYEE